VILRLNTSFCTLYILLIKYIYIFANFYFRILRILFKHFIVVIYTPPFASMSLNVEDLLKALDNENNTGVAGLTTSKIKKEKNDILQKLQLSGKELKDLHARLKEYRYINELNDLQLGRYIRWIPLNTETAEIKLTKGAITVNTFLNEDGACIVCNNSYRRPIIVKFDKVLIFQKLSEQEQILISAIDFLDKK